MLFFFFTQASDMGHSRTGAIQDHHPELLPWCKWGDSGLRHFQCRYLQPRTTVAGWCQKIRRLVISICVMISLRSLPCGNVAKKKQLTTYKNNLHGDNQKVNVQSTTTVSNTWLSQCLNAKNAPGARLYCNRQLFKRFRRLNETAKI